MPGLCAGFGLLASTAVFAQQSPPTLRRDLDSVSSAAEPQIALSSGGKQFVGQIDLTANPAVFREEETDEIIPVSQLRTVRFPPGTQSVDAVPRLHLVGRERIPGELMRLSPESAMVRVLDGPVKTLPRAALVGITWPPLAAPEPDANGRMTFAGMHRSDVGQDVAVLEGRHEVYGRLRTFSQEHVEMTGLYGLLTLPSVRLRALLLRSQLPEPRTSSGLIVELKLAGKEGEQGGPPGGFDLIRGVLVSGQAGEIALIHSYLGRIEISQASLRELEVIHEGTWQIIDPRYHHLGNESRADFDVVPPEGTSLRMTFELKSVPSAPMALTLSVIELEGEQNDATFAEQIAAGHLRTEVLLAGQEIDYLNRHVAGKSAVPQNIRIGLPRDKLREGTNELTIRQTPHRDDPNQFDDCGIFSIAIAGPPVP